MGEAHGLGVVLSKAARMRTMLLFVGRASENAVSLQMRGFCKAQDTENGHICRSSHVVCKMTSAACMRASFNSITAGAIRLPGSLGNIRKEKEMLKEKITEFCCLHSVS